MTSNFFSSCNFPKIHTIPFLDKKNFFFSIAYIHICWEKNVCIINNNLNFYILKEKKNKQTNILKINKQHF